MTQALKAARRFRRLSAADASHLWAHLARLSPDDLRQRFMGGGQRLLARRYVRGIDWRRTVIVGCFVGRSLRGVCELHPITGPRAELAVSVERRFQRRGIGHELMRRTLLLARNRGLTALELRCAGDNEAVHHLIRHFDGRITFSPLETQGNIRSLPPTALTFASEMIDEAHRVGDALSKLWLVRVSESWRPWPG